MSAESWVAISDPDELMFLLPGDISPRKLRLFCCACVRGVWYRLEHHEAFRRGVEMAEQFADGEISRQELAAYSMAIESTIRNSARTEDNNALRAAAWCVRMEIDTLGIGRSVGWGAIYSSQATNDEERAAQAHFLRDIFGNPFRPVTLEPRWLSSTVRDLARTVYDEFPRQIGGCERMAILADALMDAGCDDEEILKHCRGPGPHVRGCWVVDLILSKE